MDLYALEGIRLIAAHLVRAVQNGSDVDARAALALGSLYGGLCLGPVNTAAVHALAYPLGSQFHLPHGVSNAILLAEVLRYNLPEAPERYAALGDALGVEKTESARSRALEVVERIAQLTRQCGLPQRLSALGVPQEAIPGMAKAALQVTRLLKNNPRTVTEQAAVGIYEAIY